MNNIATVKLASIDEKSPFVVKRDFSDATISATLNQSGLHIKSYPRKRTLLPAFWKRIYNRNWINRQIGSFLGQAVTLFTDQKSCAYISNLDQVKIITVQTGFLVLVFQQSLQACMTLMSNSVTPAFVWFVMSKNHLFSIEDVKRVSLSGRDLKSADPTYAYEDTLMVAKLWCPYVIYLHVLPR